METHFDDIFYTLYAVMSPLSALGSLCLMLVFWFAAKLRTPHLTRVFWMCFCDFFLSIRHWTEFFVYKPMMDTNRTVCLLNAFGGTFFMMATMSWYFVISVCIFLTLAGKTSQEISGRKQRVLTHAYVWTCSLAAFLYPYLTNNLDGIPDDGMCWITVDSLLTRLVILVPLFIYLLWAAFLLLFGFYTMKKAQTVSTESAARSRVILRLLSFVGVFFFDMEFYLDQRSVYPF